MICDFSSKSDVRIFKDEDGYHIVVRDPVDDVWQECVFKTQFAVLKELRFFKKIKVKFDQNAYARLYNKL